MGSTIDCPDYISINFCDITHFIKMNKELMFSSKNMEWETPPELFKTLDREFNFYGDLAANKDNTKCESYWSTVSGGSSLNIDWCVLAPGRYLWLNPPYGKSLKDWVKKCDEEAQDGAKIVALLPARTDTKYFHDHIYRKYEIRFLKGRIKFLKDGEAQDAAPFPSMLVIFEKKENE